MPLAYKFVFAGSLLAVFSVFLPWYSDIDRFKTGDTFLGITGPMYLAGIIVLIACFASLGFIAMKILDKPRPKLPLTENHFHVFTSSASILMLVLALSVYFHPKFGINLTDKSAGIGVYLAFIGSGLMILGGVLAGKKKTVVNFETEGHVEPLVDLEDETRIQSGLDKAKEIVDQTNVSDPLNTSTPPVGERPIQEREPIHQPIQESIDEFADEEAKKTNDIRF